MYEFWDWLEEQLVAALVMVPLEIVGALYEYLLVWLLYQLFPLWLEDLVEEGLEELFGEWLRQFDPGWFLRVTGRLVIALSWSLEIKSGRYLSEYVLNDYYGEAFVGSSASSTHTFILIIYGTFWRSFDVDVSGHGFLMELVGLIRVQFPWE